MKRICNFIFAAAVILGFASCEKLDTAEETPAQDAVTTSSGHLVSSTLVSTIPFTKACTEAAVKAGEYGLEGYDKITDPEEIPSFLRTVLELASGDIVDPEDIPSLGMQVKTWRITYTTKGGYMGKEDVVLTADVSFLTDALGLLSRQLESISLYNSSYNAAEGDIAYLKGIIMPLRAAHNALSVYPYYQGTYSDRGKHAVTPGEFLIKGRQAIDAVLAAIELIDLISKDEKVSLAKKYYTENMGVSNGGGTSLAVHYLLENDPDMIVANEKVRLAGTFIGEGCCSYYDLIPHLMDDAPCPDEYGPTLVNIDDGKPAAFITAVVGSYYTWEISNMSSLNPSLAIMKAMYFSSDFLKVPFVNQYVPGLEANDYVEASLYGKLYWGIYGDFAGLKIENVINPLILKDGKLNVESLAIKSLLNLFKNTDKVLLSGNWSPKAPMHFKHSKVDEYVPIKFVDSIYNKLSQNGSNKSVTIEYIEEGSGHIFASLTSMFINIGLKKHPCPIEQSCSLKLK